MVEKREVVAGDGPESGSMVAVLGIVGDSCCSSRVRHGGRGYSRPARAPLAGFEGAAKRNDWD